MVYERFNISFSLLRNKLLMCFILCISSNFLLILFLHWNILFKDWLETHGDFEFIVDGANIGLYQQNFADGGFSVSQVVHSICVGFLPPPLPLFSFYLTTNFCIFHYVYVLQIAIEQLDAVVKELYNWSGNKWPLVVLHNKRLRALLENPSQRKLVEEWMDNGILYTTPTGSNDDWYLPLNHHIHFYVILILNVWIRTHSVFNSLCIFSLYHFLIY